MAAAGQQSFENLPIDIHYNKLLDWLINRRHCTQEWPAIAVRIREKINEALVDMPKITEIMQLLDGTYINYFHCLRIVELLKEDAESGKKNMFGQYSSQRMKDWMDIIRLYEKDGIFLAETAQMLARNVNYEIPALKRQIAKCQQIKKESDKKQIDYTAKAEELRKKYDSSCKQMGIEGKKIKTELAALVKDLPAEFTKISESTTKVARSVKYYDEFVNFLSDSTDRDSLPMLKHVLENGNTTTYQWRTGQKPEVVEEAKIFIDTSDEVDIEETTTDVIDWGDPGTISESGIDFGDEIDFNMADITVETGGTEANDQGEIDFGPVEHDSDSNGIDWNEVVIVDKPDSEGVAKGEDAMSILDNPRTRVLFIDDLMELEAFLSQRVMELENDTGGDILSSSQFQEAPSSIQLQLDTLVSMVSDVRDILAAFSSVKMHHLLSIRNSPRYVDRLKDTLRQLLSLADKMVFLEKEMVVKHKDAEAEQVEIQPKLDLIVKRTKEIQKQMESEISKKYKERTVNIMGEINTI